MPSKMKYSEQLSKIEKLQSGACINGCKEEDRKAFRWSFKDIKHASNFLPRALLNNNNGQGEQCRGWALSFFISENQATTELKRLCDDKSKLYKKLGTHIAEGMIVKSDGVNGHFNEASGHFSHFEYEKTDFSKKFKVKTEIFTLK